MRTLTVLGATGKTGRHVAKMALAQGDWKVRTAGRRPAAVGEHRFLDWDEPESWRPAVDGSDAVYLIVPFTHAGAAERTPALIQALGTADVGKVVLLSSLDAEGASAEDPLRRAESAVVALEQPSAIIRPTWFMDNFLTGSFAPMVTEGVLRLPAGDGAIPFVDVRDIAEVALAAVDDGPIAGVLPVTGPSSVTHHELARALASCAGRPVRYESVSRNHFVEYMMSRGFGRDYAAFLGLALEQVADGLLTIPVHDTVSTVLGRRAYSVEDFAAYHAEVLCGCP